MKNLYIVENTISSIATPQGIGGVGIIRVSGDNVKDVASKVLKKKLKTRVATLVDIYANNTIIDNGIAIFFKKPYSFTGEDVLEIHAHGSDIILKRILRAIIKTNKNIRLSEPGEFTLRAFLNGKIDLMQAECINELIHSKSELGAGLALKGVLGETSSEVNNISERLYTIRAGIEALIDFTEEEDINKDVESMYKNIKETREVVLKLLCKYNTCSLNTNGVKIAIIGEPNVGKSSLVNSILKKKISIVSSTPGTTRDVIKERFLIGGLPVSLIDTAGLRVSTCEIEMEGIQLAKDEISRASIILVVIDDMSYLEYCELSNTKIRQQIIKRFSIKVGDEAKIFIIRNKSDLLENNKRNIKEKNNNIFFLSAKTGLGISNLMDAVNKEIIGVSSNTEGCFMINERHYISLKKVNINLMKSLRNTKNIFIEEAAEDLRVAHEKILEILGKNLDSETILEKIFSSFCIGK